MLCNNFGFNSVRAAFLLLPTFRSFDHLLNSDRFRLSFPSLFDDPNDIVFQVTQHASLPIDVLRYSVQVLTFRGCPTSREE